MNRAMINCGYVLCLLGAISTVCEAVKITSLKVPSVYILDNQDNSDQLILDCEYDLKESEKGFVLKWLLNEQRIYQWIPSNPQPHSMNVMKNHINVNYTASTDYLHKHRALAIVNPTLNMTGNYSCNVGSYTSEDRQAAFLQIIVPESDLKIELLEDEDENYKVQCWAKKIFPAPNLKIVIGANEIGKDFLSKINRDDGGLYDVSIFGKLKKDDVKDPGEITCVLDIPGTNYTKILEASKFLNNSSKLSLLSVSWLLLVTILFTLLMDNSL